MDYRIRPIGKACTATGEPLAPEAVCYSALVHRAGELVRLDFAESEWSGPPEGTVGFWKATVPPVESSKPKPLDPDALMSCFEKLSDEAEQGTERFRYVLALLLLQKRRLEIDGTRDDGDEQFLQLVGTRGEGLFEVRDQRLEGNEFEQVQQELTSRLAGVWS